MSDVKRTFKEVVMACKFVPAGGSLRYRKRAHAAEQRLRCLTEGLRDVVEERGTVKAECEQLRTENLRLMMSIAAVTEELHLLEASLSVPESYIGGVRTCKYLQTIVDKHTKPCPDCRPADSGGLCSKCSSLALDARLAPANTEAGEQPPDHNGGWFPPPMGGYQPRPPGIPTRSHSSSE